MTVSVEEVIDESGPRGTAGDSATHRTGKVSNVIALSKSDDHVQDLQVYNIICDNIPVMIHRDILRWL